MPAKWKPPDIDDLVERYVSGIPAQTLAQANNICTAAVQRALADAGVPIRGVREAIALRGPWRTPRVIVDTAAIVDSFQSGVSVKALADTHGVSRNVIAQRLRRSGIAPRDRSEGMFARMALTSADERLALSAAAHAAAKGRQRSLAELSRAALTRERRGLTGSGYESTLIGWLHERGKRVTPQKAIGPYNADVAVGAVAVDVFGGNWHGSGRHARRFPNRARYIFDQGWCLLIIWVNRDHPLTTGAADYVVSLAELAGRDPSLRGQYRVIWGGGQEAPCASGDLDQLARVPALYRAVRTRS